MSEPCNIDDVLCQLETLRHLRGLQQEMGKEAFIKRFPEFAELGNKIADEIVKSEDSFSEALQRCQMTQEEVEEVYPEEEES